MIKKTISLLLTIIIVFSTLAVAVNAFDTYPTDKPPLVYVEGQAPIYDDPSSPDAKEIPMTITPEMYVKSQLPCVGLLAKAIATQEWDEYANAFADSLIPFFDEYGLDNNGNVKNTSGTQFKWSYDSISTNYYNDSVFTYEYRYDQRLDPWEVADDLNAYIQAVKEKTHNSKVCLMSRCMGTATAMAYLVKYGEKNNFADICSFVYYNSTAMGFPITNDLYNGQLQVDDINIARYAMQILGDDTIDEALKASVTLLQKTYGIKLAGDMLTDIYNKIYKIVFPKIMRASYGSTPGYWGMVSDPYYEQAKQFIFGDQASDYAGLIEKIDFFHQNVQKCIPDMLLKLCNTGMSVGVVCKYGLQMMPIVGEADLQSDDLIDVASQSLGATCPKFGEKLSDDYIAKARNEGREKYISPDREVDASTCLLPDRTWFVKNVEHQIMPQGIDPLLVSIARSKTPMTIESNPNYPQYMLYHSDTDSMTILTADNCEARQPDKTFIGALIDLIKSLLKLIVENIPKLIEKF